MWVMHRVIEQPTREEREHASGFKEVEPPERSEE